MVPKQLTRTCAACGLEKPLVAFLQITAQGTSYGTLCASCRSDGAKIKKHEADEDFSGTSSDRRIGSKEKSFLDKENFRQSQDNKESYKKDIKRKDTLINEKKEKASITDKWGKQHRQDYLGSKRNFLGNKIPASKATSFDTLENLKLATEKNTETISHGIKDEEIRKVAENFSAFYHPIQEGRLEFHTSAFLEFINTLGPRLPIVRLLADFNKKLGGMVSDKKPPRSLLSEKKISDVQNQEDKTQQELINFATKSWTRKP